jgi:hypothetical protein
MLIIFFDCKGIVHKESVMTGQTVDSAYYCDVLRRLCENLRRLRTELWQQNKMAAASWQVTVSHFLFFSPGIFGPKTKWLSSPTHPTFLCFFPIEENWKVAILTQLRWSMQNVGQWWTPSQNTTSRIHFKMSETLGTVHTRGRGLLRRWWWPDRPKVSFDQMAAPVPEIKDSTLYIT